MQDIPDARMIVEQVLHGQSAVSPEGGMITAPLTTAHRVTNGENNQ